MAGESDAHSLPWLGIRQPVLAGFVDDGLLRSLESEMLRQCQTYRRKRVVGSRGNLLDDDAALRTLHSP